MVQWMCRRALCAVAVLWCFPLVTGAQPSATQPTDPWQPIRTLVGTWEGRAQGQPGSGTARRTYAFVLNDRYLHETNVTNYPPQPKNSTGEEHQHWSFFSYDRARRALVLRQFHQEGFVNQYVMNAGESRAGHVVFDSERFENLDAGWRARETYDIASPDAFTETFEVADPGKPLEVYSRTAFTRSK